MSSPEFAEFDRFPEWAVCYFMYGDDSGLDPEDRRIADDWHGRLGLGRLVEAYDGGGTFCSDPEFGLACNVCKAVFEKGG